MAVAVTSVADFLGQDFLGQDSLNQDSLEQRDAFVQRMGWYSQL
jgi:hypothetical protein